MSISAPHTPQHVVGARSQCRRDSRYNSAPAAMSRRYAKRLALWPPQDDPRRGDIFVETQRDAANDSVHAVTASRIAVLQLRVCRGSRRREHTHRKCCNHCAQARAQWLQPHDLPRANDRFHALTSATFRDLYHPPFHHPESQELDQTSRSNTAHLLRSCPLRQKTQ